VEAPTVSALIPTYDRPHFLAEALRSVVSQPVEGLEVIVGDDGTLGKKVVDELADPRVRYVLNRPRLGMAGNWASLLDAARGRYLALLMDDDRWMEEFLPKSLAVLNANRDVGVVFTNHLFDRDGERFERRCPLAGGLHEDFVVDFLRLNPVPISAAVFRREAWKSARPLPDTAAADIVLFGRMADAGWPFFYIDQPLMIYRDHPAMFSASMSFRNDAVRAWEELLVTAPEAITLRDRSLADALVSRAATRGEGGDLEAARNDLRRAMVLGPSSPARVRAMLTVFGQPATANLAARAFRLLRGARRVTVRKR
jgi:glycosyltransferase involved in cell wall biosynthesis